MHLARVGKAFGLSESGSRFKTDDVSPRLFKIWVTDPVEGAVSSSSSLWRLSLRDPRFTTFALFGDFFIGVLFRTLLFFAFFFFLAADFGLALCLRFSGG